MDDVKFKVTYAEAAEKDDYIASEEDGVFEQIAEYIVPFPLKPNPDPAVCHDLYLQNTLQNCRTIKRHTRMRQKTSTFNFHSAAVTTAEGMLILKLQEDRESLSSYDEDFIAPPMTSEEKRIKYAELNQSLKAAAISKFCIGLIKKLSTLQNGWPGSINASPRKMFFWSLSHFYERADTILFYLDVLERDKSDSELDCLKFKIDLHEIKVLLNEIRNDVTNNENICNSFMVKLAEADYDERTGEFGKSGQMRNRRSNLMHELFMHSRNVPKKIRAKKKELYSLAREQDATEPVENRYRLNWLQSATDQNTYLVEKKTNEMRDEVISIRNRLLEDGFSFAGKLNAYNEQINNLRGLIDYWTVKYDTDFDAAEFKCSASSISIQKVKDDLKYYNDQVVYFRERVKKMSAIIEQEKEEARLKAEKLSKTAELEALKKLGKGKKKSIIKKKK